MFDSVLKLLLLSVGLSILALFALKTAEFETQKKKFLTHEFQTRRCASIDAAIANIESAAETLKKNPENANKVIEQTELLSNFFLDLWLNDKCTTAIQNRYALKHQTTNYPNIEYILTEQVSL